MRGASYSRPSIGAAGLALSDPEHQPTVDLGGGSPCANCAQPCESVIVIVGFGRIPIRNPCRPDRAHNGIFSGQVSQASAAAKEVGRGTVNARARSSRCRRENQSSSSRCWRETPCRVRVRACGCGVSGAPWESGSRSLFLDVAALSHAPFLAFFCRQRCAVPGFVLVAYS